MTLGIGGREAQVVLDSLQDMTAGSAPIELGEYNRRIQKVRAWMAAQSIELLYVNAGTNLQYFTGTIWHASERMVGALIPIDGDIEYLAPVFELPTLKQYQGVEGQMYGWEEHECPYKLFAKRVAVHCGNKSTLALDESCPFFIADGIRRALPENPLINASCVTAACRMIKSSTELALMKRAKEMTLAVHKAAASVLHVGLSTVEVEAFIHEAHKRVGAPSGSYFVIVLFGEATAYPHGVKDPQILKDGDMVLIDTGCKLHGYISDITRSYVFGEPTTRQRDVWDAEKQAQAAAFAAAQIGATCASVDLAARARLQLLGFGPDYNLPGLPHRTGHGIGLDIHEWPYLNSGDQTLLQSGMCFSNEPMICAPGEFGIRLEDHFYMTDEGPVWFTEPSPSIDDPFALSEVI